MPGLHQESIKVETISKTELAAMLTFKKPQSFFCCVKCLCLFLAARTAEGRPGCLDSMTCSFTEEAIKCEGEAELSLERSTLHEHLAFRNLCSASFQAGSDLED